MRGDGDAPMGGEEGKDHEYTPNEKKNIALLKRIVNDQRQIIRKVTENPSIRHHKYGLFTKKFKITTIKE